VENEKAPQSLAHIYHQEHYINNAQNENCALLGYNAASNATSLPMFRDNLLVPSFKGKKFKNSSPWILVPSSKVKNSRTLLPGFLNLEDGTDRLSRNVDKKLPQLAA
jgi:hypothetical protein